MWGGRRRAEWLAGNYEGQVRDGGSVRLGLRPRAGVRRQAVPPGDVRSGTPDGRQLQTDVVRERYQLTGPRVWRIAARERAKYDGVS